MENEQHPQRGVGHLLLGQSGGLCPQELQEVPTDVPLAWKPSDLYWEQCFWKRVHLRAEPWDGDNGALWTHQHPHPMPFRYVAGMGSPGMYPSEHSLSDLWETRHHASSVLLPCKQFDSRDGVKTETCDQCKPNSRPELYPKELSVGTELVSICTVRSSSHM